MSTTATQPAPDEGVADDVAEDMEAGSPAPPHARSWSRRHPINIRVSIPFFGIGFFYVTFLAGKERRDGERLRDEREKHPLLTGANMVFLFIAGFLVGGASWIVLRALALWILGSTDA